MLSWFESDLWVLSWYSPTTASFLQSLHPTWQQQSVPRALCRMSNQAVKLWEVILRSLPGLDGTPCSLEGLAAVRQPASLTINMLVDRFLQNESVQKSTWKKLVCEMKVRDQPGHHQAQVCTAAIADSRCITRRDVNRDVCICLCPALLL